MQSAASSSKTGARGPPGVASPMEPRKRAIVVVSAGSDKSKRRFARSALGQGKEGGKNAK